MDLRMNHSRALITGAAGLIGSAVARAAAAHGAQVYAVDALGVDARWRNLARLPIADYWDRDEFLDRIERGRSLPRFDAVIHLGASTDTTERDAGFLMRNNFAYTRALAQWCRARGVRFLYASSAATYGDGALGCSDDPALLPKLRPLNAYAYSKHAFDLWALQAGAFTGPNGITGLKYFNVYGPGEAHKGEMRSMVLKAYEQIQATGKVRLFQSHRPEYGNGEQVRDFLYVDDAAAMTLWFLDHPDATGIFNLGSGTARTWNDLARAVFAALGRTPAIDYVPMPEAIRAAYQYATCADLGRLRAAGCTLQARTLEVGVKDYVCQLERTGA
jgi:ADP-L-glycero-D-manno-heptose 6-epimerase